MPRNPLFERGFVRDTVESSCGERFVEPHKRYKQERILLSVLYRSTVNEITLTKTVRGQRFFWWPYHSDIGMRTSLYRVVLYRLLYNK